MSRRPIKYEKGKGGKRINTQLDEGEFEEFEKIRKFIATKFGVNTATDAAVVRAAIKHYADHINKGEVS